ncbi:MAG TPA: tRNA (N(6)-L-threonylcarbamoyladenosine(37)-C(2))-methylthiotransferase MtaB [bacterium]|nr:tRNA (N(6)-L-threonylcarbamoyladenosine(37)-C(2))-methylthiotransferase MtaB [bacterium]
MDALTRPKIAFTTLGCRVNQYDGQALKEQAERASFDAVPFDEKADIYVINTCTVTSAADSEGKQLVRRAKGRNPDSFVVVTGCLAQDRPEEIAALAGVDLVVGNAEKSLLVPRILERFSRPLSTPSALPDPSPWLDGITRFDGHQRATVKVQDGCNFGCSFCLIPRVRGTMVSRPVLEIVEEGKRLASHGVKELVLAGIQLSSYGRDWGLKASEPRLAPVLEKLLSVPGIQRVRLSSYAVADFEEALLPLWESGQALCAHLHLPLQSGDEGVLRAMRRPYSLAQFAAVVEKVRRAAPQVGLTTDLIAGFPGETEQAFRNTEAQVREFGFVDLHPFPYSDRPDTPGAALVPKVHPAVIRERMDRLWALKREVLARAAERAVGREFRVIVERYDDQRQSGLTDEGLRVVFPRMAERLGQEARVRVTGAGPKTALAQWA